MAEILNPEDMLKMIGDYQPLARVFLATAGTLQSTLSAYFSTPVVVEVVSQHESEGLIVRAVNLVRSDSGDTVVRATTTIQASRDDVLEMVRAEHHGVGQILILLDIRSQFELLEVGEDHGTVWRLYRLAGEGVSYEIREEFPRAAFSALNK
jgi:hypothetical protein